MTGAQLLTEAARRLKSAGLSAAATDARILLAEALEIPRERLTLHLPEQVSAAQQARYDRLIAHRLRHQPVAQIIGRRIFLGRTFRVTPDVLDPRPETEILVQTALSGPFESVLDLGTGSGCVLLSLLAERPTAHGLGSDISPAALAVARKNAMILGISNATFILSDWYHGLSGRFDLIVSNPPYIAAAEMACLAPDVRDWEPEIALTPGGDGLEAYRRIIAGARGHLAPGGRLCLEIGPTQGAAVSTLLRAAGFKAADIVHDLDGRDRVVRAS